MPEIILNGPEGRLEARYHHSKLSRPPVAVVLHPNPVYGGTMNNKVAYHIFKCFVKHDFSVLRFNFRGVGRSQGDLEDINNGALSDATAALDWLQVQNPEASSYWVGGFSFGAWIGMQLLMRRPEIEGFISISPPASTYDFSFLSPCPAPGLIVQGDSDDIVNESDVSRLVDKLQKQKNTNIDYRVILEADHFFHSKLDILNDHMEDYLKKWLQQRGSKPKKVRPDRRRRQKPDAAPQS